MLLFPCAGIGAPQDVPRYIDTLWVGRPLGAGAPVKYEGKGAVSADSAVVLPDLGLAVRLTGVNVGRAAIVGDSSLAEEDYAVVTFATTNTSEAKKAQYTVPNVALGRLAASLSDEHQNVYKWVTLPVGARLAGRPTADNESIYPGKILTDAVLFEVPVAAARTLTFRLPLAVYSAKDKRSIAFAIPVDGMLAELAQKRKAFAAALATGIPGLDWRMKPSQVREIFPGMKRNPDFAGGGDIMQEWYALDTSLAGRRAATVEAKFFRGELYRLDLKTELSLAVWTNMVRPRIGEPETASADRAIWRFGNASLTVFTESYAGGTVAIAAYGPLLEQVPTALR